MRSNTPNQSKLEKLPLLTIKANTIVARKNETSNNTPKVKMTSCTLPVNILFAKAVTPMQSNRAKKNAIDLSAFIRVKAPDTAKMGSAIAAESTNAADGIEIIKIPSFFILLLLVASSPRTFVSRFDCTHALPLRSPR